MNAALIITIGIILVPITALILIGLGKIFLMQKEEFWKSPFRFFILTVMPIVFLIGIIGGAAAISLPDYYEKMTLTRIIETIIFSLVGIGIAATLIILSL